MSNNFGRYSFNNFTGILSFTMPTFVHSSCQVWMRQWEENLKNASEEFDETSFMVLDGATLIDFKGRYKTRQASDFSGCNIGHF